MSSTSAPVQPVPGASLPLHKGYDAESRSKVRKPTDKDASGFLLDADGNVLNLWITNISTDFSISGQVGQSRMVREWFPRSFNDVALIITGNATSTTEYNEIARFVRVAQWRALQKINAGQPSSQTITFGLFDRTPSSWTTQGTRQTPATVKGPHRPWSVSGYVRTIQAGATHQEVAPEYTINFIVAASVMQGNTGLWGDDLATVTPLTSIQTLIGQERRHGKHQTGFVVDPIGTPGGQYGTASKHANQGLWSAAGVVGLLTL